MLSIIASISVPSIDASAKAKNIKCAGLYTLGKYKIGMSMYGTAYDEKPYSNDCGEIIIYYKKKVVWDETFYKTKTNNYLYCPSNGYIIKIKVMKKKIKVTFAKKFKKNKYKVKSGTYKLKTKWSEFC